MASAKKLKQVPLNFFMASSPQCEKRTELKKRKLSEDDCVSSKTKSQKSSSNRNVLSACSKYGDEPDNDIVTSSVMDITKDNDCLTKSKNPLLRFFKPVLTDDLITSTSPPSDNEGGKENIPPDSSLTAQSNVTRIDLIRSSDDKLMKHARIVLSPIPIDKVTGELLRYCDEHNSIQKNAEKSPEVAKDSKEMVVDLVSDSEESANVSIGTDNHTATVTPISEQSNNVESASCTINATTKSSSVDFDELKLSGEIDNKKKCIDNSNENYNVDTGSDVATATDTNNANIKTIDAIDESKSQSIVLVTGNDDEIKSPLPNKQKEEKTKVTPVKTEDSSPAPCSDNKTPASAKRTPKAMSAKKAERMAQRQRVADEKEKARQEAKEAKQKLKEEKDEERRTKIELLKKEKQEAKEKKDKERQELQDRKEKERRDKLEEERQRRQTILDAKNEEKKKKDEEKRLKDEDKRLKEEEKNKEKEEEIMKIKKAQDKFQSFFKKTKSSPPMKVRPATPSIFMPFEVKDNMSLAPIARRCLTDGDVEKVDLQLMSQGHSHLYIEELKHRNVQRQSRRSANSGNEDLVVIGHDSAAVKTVTHPAKFLLFHTNHRPPYYGTWTKRSSCISPRNPWKKDLALLDYEVDSDDEWEEEEPGESLSNSEGEDKDDEDQGDDDDEDGWLVPHGYLSAGEGADEEEDVTIESLKLRQKAKQEAWDREMKTKQMPAKAEVIGCFWDRGGKAMPDNADLLLSLEICVLVPCPIQTTHSGYTPPPQEVTPKNRGSKPKPVPHKAMPHLIRFIHGNQSGIARLLSEFRKQWPLIDSGKQEEIIRNSTCADGEGISPSPDVEGKTDDKNDDADKKVDKSEIVNACEKMENESDKKEKLIGEKLGTETVKDEVEKRVREGYPDEDFTPAKRPKVDETDNRSKEDIDNVGTKDGDNTDNLCQDEDLYCEFSKTGLRKKILSIAVREKREGFRRYCWYVHKEVLEKYDLLDLPLPSDEDMKTPARSTVTPQTCLKESVGKNQPCISLFTTKLTNSPLTSPGFGIKPVKLDTTFQSVTNNDETNNCQSKSLLIPETETVAAKNVLTKYFTKVTPLKSAANKTENPSTTDHQNEQMEIDNLKVSPKKDENVNDVIMLD